MSLEDVKNLGLNVLILQTENSEEPTCEYVSAPSGSMGKSITNATKVPGSLIIISPSGDLLYDSGNYVKGESGMTVKIRGNTSAYASKKPYKIKLQKKADLLLRGDKKYNDKNWVLLNDNHLKLHTGFEISRLLQEEWTPSGMYVNVVMNNDYKGIYYLVESVERNEKSRIDVSDSGFIVEHDAYWWNENGAYVLSGYNPSLNYTFKYPDYEDISSSELNEISKILSDYEKSLSGNFYTDLIDQESFVKWILGHDILGTSDGGGANFYLSKYDLSPNSSIKAGPLWDFDTIELYDNSWSAVHTAFHRFDNLFEEDAPFMKVFKEFWKNNGKRVYEGILDFLEDYKNQEKWMGYELSSVATSKFWGGAHKAVDAALRDEEWFKSRFEWLKSRLGEFYENPSEEASLPATDLNPANKYFDIYTIQGIRILTKATKDDLNKLGKGLYIIEGRKVFIR